MPAVISLNGIDEAISNLRYRSERSPAYRLVRIIRSYYEEGSLSSPAGIDQDKLIRVLWETGDDALLIKSKRKNLSSIKSSINADLRRLYEKGMNPEGILIGSDNTFTMSDEVKDEILRSFTEGVKGDGAVSLKRVTDVLQTVNDLLSNRTDKVEGLDDPGLAGRLEKLVRDLSEKVGRGGQKEGEGFGANSSYAGGDTDIGSKEGTGQVHSGEHHGEGASVGGESEAGAIGMGGGAERSGAGGDQALGLSKTGEGEGPDSPLAEGLPDEEEVVEVLEEDAEEATEEEIPESLDLVDDAWGGDAGAEESPRAGGEPEQGDGDGDSGTGVLDHGGQPGIPADEEAIELVEEVEDEEEVDVLDSSGVGVTEDGQGTGDDEDLKTGEGFHEKGEGAGSLNPSGGDHAESENLDPGSPYDSAFEEEVVDLVEEVEEVEEEVGNEDAEQTEFSDAVGSGGDGAGTGEGKGDPPFSADGGTGEVGGNCEPGAVVGKGVCGSAGMPMEGEGVGPAEELDQEEAEEMQEEASISSVASEGTGSLPEGGGEQVPFAGECSGGAGESSGASESAIEGLNVSGSSGQDSYDSMEMSEEPLEIFEEELEEDPEEENVEEVELPEPSGNGGDSGVGEAIEVPTGASGERLGQGAGYGGSGAGAEHGAGGAAEIPMDEEAVDLVEEVEEEEPLDDAEEYDASDPSGTGGAEGGPVAGGEEAVQGSEGGPAELGLPSDNLGSDSAYTTEDQISKASLLAEEFDGYLGAMERYYNQYILIPKGRYVVGSRRPRDDEQKEIAVQLPLFYMGKFPVTNALFEIFVEKTGYKTTAEKRGSGLVYTGRLQKRLDEETGKNEISWSSALIMKEVPGACWHQPHGPGSSLHQKRNHPVVQVSLEDALAFAAWTGKRLPTEEEWEAASRTARGHLYPWGEEWREDRCNIESSYVADTTPVDRYAQFANEMGISDTLGNVIEWTLTRSESPPGTRGRSGEPRSIAKGGSWTSQEHICLFSRFSLDPESRSNILGFRCMAI